MDKYESISVVGEGSYGVVMKCRHKETGQVVAIKKFIETEEDQTVRKMAMREIRMLKAILGDDPDAVRQLIDFLRVQIAASYLIEKLRHENLVNLIEVFRRKRRFYLVFEYMDHTVLDELEEHTSGLGDETCKQHIFQVMRGVEFCHHNSIVHRDIKPENILVSRLGVIKICDFGFARLLAQHGESYTDYVATRWYRAPELLVGDTKYGREVDIWAIGCLFAEMMTGDPLFPGDSDIDQLFQITKVLGKMSQKHQAIVAKNPMFKGFKKGSEEGVRSLFKIFPGWPNMAIDLLSLCLKMDPMQRPSASELLRHPYFTHDHFAERFLPELKSKIQQEFQGNPLIRKYQTEILGSAFRKRDRLLPEEPKVVSMPQRRSLIPESLRWRLEMFPNGSQRSTVPDSSYKTRRKTSDTPVISEMEDSKTGMDTGDSQPLSASPTPFQSLESTFQTPTIGSSSQILHPSINNLSFSNTQTASRLVEPLKYSPQPFGKQNQRPFQNIINSSSFQMQPRTQLLRRLDRNLMIDQSHMDRHLQVTGMDSPANEKWFSSRRMGQGTVGTPWKPNKADDFSLPNVPGASASPNKGLKKKLTPVISQGSAVNDSFLSPRRNPSSQSPSQSPKSKYNQNLPFV